VGRWTEAKALVMVAAEATGGGSADPAPPPVRTDPTAGAGLPPRRRRARQSAADGWPERVTAAWRAMGTTGTCSGRKPLVSTCSLGPSRRVPHEALAARHTSGGDRP